VLTKRGLLLMQPELMSDCEGSGGMGYVQRSQPVPLLESTCPRCGGPARLLAALGDPTGEADYQLVHCERCGRRERMNAAPRTTSVLPKYRRDLLGCRSHV
jgi:ribosomal protein S27AE